MLGTFDEKQSCFLVTTPNGVEYYIVAPNNVEADLWIAAIKAAAAYDAAIEEPQSESNCNSAAPGGAQATSEQLRATHDAKLSEASKRESIKHMMARGENDPG